ncbi:MAG TPA: choice-of-anchor D domain-containing protein [Kofleriaceae bacterium]|nr:choice-of-anchor D domain-containing protein [Kofleriaceae bacterium]
MQSYARAALFTLVLAACDEENPDFADAGRDASIDAAPAPIGMLPASVPLAITDCGATNQTTFQVVNTGTADLTYALAFSDAAFTVTPASGTIVSGASTTFTVMATVPQDATAGQTLTAMLTATTNLPGSPHTVPVTVMPRGAHITITPPSVGFGQVEAGTTSTPSNALIANTGNAPAMVTVASPGGEFTRIFGTTGTLTLAGSQSADASFAYHPTAVGADTGSAAVTVTGVHCGTTPTTIGLTGSGAVTGGVLVQGTPVDFGTVACGASSDTDTITLMNTAEIPAAYTATFPTDPEGDHARYSVAPTSGTIPANSSVTLTITRNAITLPFQPRAVGANLRIHVDIPTGTDTDVAVSQTLTGPFLGATPTTQNFGFANVGGTRSGPVTINNTGNAAATLQTTMSAPFTLALPSMVAGTGSGSGTMTYAPTALGTVNSTATVTAPGICSGPVTFNFTAGDGPLAGISASSASVTCPAPSTFDGFINVSNGGNQQLSVTCVDVNAGSNNLAAAFDPSPLTVNTSGYSQIRVTVASPTPVRAGATSTTLRCTTNEPLGGTYDLSFTRTLSGTDLALAAPAELDFVCGIPARLPYTVTSAATSNLPAFINPQELLVMPPFGHEFTQVQLLANGVMTNNVTLHGGGSGTGGTAVGNVPIFHGIPDPCSGSANPGDLVFTGDVHVASGSSSNICSVTPASLPVELRMGAPAAQ